MPDMQQDLKARLREYPATRGNGDALSMDYVCTMSTEAADRIEALEAQLAERDALLRESSGALKAHNALALEMGEAEDFVAQVIPDAKRSNNQPADANAKKVRRQINETRRLLTQIDNLTGQAK